MVGKFVEFFGPGLHTLGLADRATIGNMSPEFGSTCAIFPVDRETLRYLEFTGRPTELIELVDAYAREQGMFHDEDSDDPTFSETLELDLGSVEPSHRGAEAPAGPDRAAERQARPSSSRSRSSTPRAAEALGNHHDDAVAESFPASDPPGDDHDGEAGKPRHAGTGARTAVAERSDDAVTVTLEDGTEVALDHGRVVIAAITSCTNTSNPSVMLGAGLLAKKAVERGLESQAVGEDVAGARARPSSPTTWSRPGLTSYLDQLGFNLVGYGCTTCIGNSGPLPEAISRGGRRRTTWWSARCSPGNRNFEGRINQDVRNNYLASPPLCVAYALAGRMDIDLLDEPLGEGADGEPVYLRDLWPSLRGDQADRRERRPLGHVHARATRTSSRATSAGAASTPPTATATPGPTRPTSASRPFFEGMDAEPAAGRADRGRAGARGARRLGHDRPHLARRRDQEGQPGRAGG